VPQFEEEEDEEVDQEFLALEQEVREALQGASLTASQLEGIARSGHADKATLPEVTAALRAQLQSGGVDPEDLRATEEMLLDLLGGSAAAALGPSGDGASKMEQLAGELSQWDHRTDPLGASIKAPLRTAAKK
jgi:hypothetical protein